MQITIEAKLVDSGDDRVQYMKVEDMYIKIEDDKVVGFHRPNGELPEIVDIKDWISLNPYYAECPYCGQVRFREDQGWYHCPHCGKRTTGRIKA